ncbi:MAG: alpha/beta hydrolase [Actinomycetota bacterium]|nr:alpha/beta hydrolase [Actinomycetota bacterium]
MTSAPPVRRVPVADGVALHVVTWESFDLVPFLLVHGLASNCRTWEGVAARLAALGHPVATVDLRGHGQSDQPDEGYDFATLCTDLLAVLDDVGFARPVVAGQSTGGNLAVELAARAPGRVGGVAGVDGGALELSRRWPEWEGCVNALAPPRLAGSPARLVEDRLRASHPDWSEWAIVASMANFEVLPEGAVRPWLRFDRHLAILRSLWEQRPSKIIPTLDVPVLLVMADSGDSWVDHKRAMADEIASSAPKVRIEWFSPGDHDLHLQFPVELAELLHRSF